MTEILVFTVSTLCPCLTCMERRKIVALMAQRQLRAGRIDKIVRNWVDHYDVPAELLGTPQHNQDLWSLVRAVKAAW